MNDKTNLQTTTFQQPLAQAMPESVQGGYSMTQLDTKLFKAVQEIPPRDMERFEKNVLREAHRSGESFYYQWEVKGEKSRGLVRGGSINLAMRMLSNYGKATVINDIVNTNSREWVISSTFVDFENGVTFNRVYIQRKATNMGAKMDSQRAEDMALSNGISKSMRNVILAAMPGYLVDEAIEAAQSNELTKIEKEGVVKARDKAVAYLKKNGVTTDRIEAKFEKKLTEFDAQNVVELRGMCKAILDGQVDPAGMFPVVEKPEPEKAADKKKTAAALFGQEPKPEAQTADAMLAELDKKYGDEHVARVLADHPGDWNNATEAEQLEMVAWVLDRLEGKAE